MSAAPAPAGKKIALIMPGGGARAAYQVGVLKALSELDHCQYNNPFAILSGTSAGAINAVALASRNESFRQACKWLEGLWLDLQCEHVYRTDWIGIAGNAWRLLLSLFNAGIAVGRPVGLLDNLPLKQLLRHKIDFTGIGRNLQNGKIEAVCVTAMNYTESASVSFYQGGPDNAEWRRWRRQGVPTPLQLRHLIASTAIPTIFPPQRIGRNYYGDGALRQLAPLSPALHLGAEKLLVISVSGHKKTYQRPFKRIHSPAFGQVLGHLLNSAFVDSLANDIEMLEQINELLTQIPGQQFIKNGHAVKPIDIHVISPSVDIDTLADEYVCQLPASLRAFLRITGAGQYEGGINIASYLLFTADFTNTLINLGYSDTRKQMEQLSDFLLR